MTKPYAAGDQSQAICAQCAKLVSATFAHRDIAFDDGSGVVRDILAAVCDVCDAVVAVPAQSTPTIRRARKASHDPSARRG